MTDGSRMLFKTKRLQFEGEWRRVVCQNENGPCPLLAVCNALLLRGAIELPAGVTEVDSGTLQHCLVSYVLDKNENGSGDDNLRHQLHEVIALIGQSRFLRGIDVNLKFGDSTDFEFTGELALFDLAGVRMVHGWIVDSHDPIHLDLRARSYNDVSAAVVSFLHESDLPHDAVTASLSDSLRRTLSRRLSSLGPADASDSALRAPAPRGGTAQEAGSRSLETVDMDVRRRGELSDHTSQQIDAMLAAMLRDVEVESARGARRERGDVRTGAGAEGSSAQVMVEAAQASDSRHVEADGAAVAPADSGAQFSREQLLRMARFLNETQSQLTVAGLFSLAEKLHPGELAVFFRNNHFNTIYKHPSSSGLYILVTDQGYQAMEGVAWEKLDNERGDTTIVSADFRDYQKYVAEQEQEQAEILKQIRLAEELLQDLLAGMQLELEHAAAAAERPAVPDARAAGTDAASKAGCDDSKETAGAVAQADHDYALALHLQQQEEEALERPMASAEGAVMTQTPPQAPPSTHGDPSLPHRPPHAAHPQRTGRTRVAVPGFGSSTRNPGHGASSSQKRGKDSSCTIM